MSAASNVLTQTMPARSRPRQPMGPVDVARPDPGRQPVGRVVGDRAGRRPRRRTRSRSGPARRSPRERPATALSTAVEDRRRDEEAAGLLADPSAAGDEPGALRPGRAGRSRGPSRAGGRRRSRRAGSSGSSGSPGASRATEGRDPLDELLADRPMDDEPRPGVAGLAAVVEDPPADRRRGRLEIADVGEDDLRALAAELEGDRLDVRGRRSARSSDLPTSVEPVNATLSTPGWRASASPTTAPGPGTTLRTPSGQSGLARQLGQAQRRERRLRRRLQHDRVPGRQGRPELPGGDDERVVPRHDRGDDAERLAGDERQRIRPGRADLAVDLVDGLGVPLERRRRGWDVDAERVPDRLADVERLEQRELLEVRRGSARRSGAARACGSPATDRPSVGRRTPGGRPRRPGRRPRASPSATRAMTEPSRPVDVLERPAGRRRHEPAVDERLGPRRDRGGPGDPVLGGPEPATSRSRRVPLDAPRRRGRPRDPGRRGTRRTPSGPGRIGSASMKSRRSGRPAGRVVRELDERPAADAGDHVEVGEEPDARSSRCAG